VNGAGLGLAGDLVGGRIGSSEERRKKRNAGKKSWRSPAFLDESTATGVEGTSWGESARRREEEQVDAGPEGPSTTTRKRRDDCSCAATARSCGGSAASATIIVGTAGRAARGKRGDGCSGRVIDGIGDLGAGGGRERGCRVSTGRGERKWESSVFRGRRRRSRSAGVRTCPARCWQPCRKQEKDMNIGTWSARVRLRPVKLELVVTDHERDLLRASLPTPQSHPRALVTLLEGLALWQGAVLRAAVYADERADWSGLFGLGLSGRTLEDPASPLIDAHEVGSSRRRRRLGQLDLPGGGR
jgi:hypothetical protein